MTSKKIDARWWSGKLWVIALLFVLGLSSCKLQKAYNALNAGNYQEARDHLTAIRAKDKHNPAVQYGLALWYFRQDHPGHDLDSAQIFLQRAQSAIDSIDKPKKREHYAKLGVRPYLLQQLEERLHERAFQRAKDTHTVKAYQHFIEHYPNAQQVSRARSKRNELAFEQAQESFTFKSFKKFLEQYPNAPQADEAREKYEYLLYKTKTKEDTYEAYRQFMENHPNSPYYDEARKKYQKKLYQAYTEIGTVKSYKEFIEKYPDHPKVEEAMDRIFQLAIDDHTVAAYKNFIQNNPDNRNINKAWERLYTLATLDDTPESYKNFKEKYPSFPYADRLARDLRLAKRNPVTFRENGQYGYVDTATSDTLIDAVFGDATPFAEGLAAVAKGDCDTSECKYGYIDKTGKTVIPYLYDDALPFQHGVAIVGEGSCQTSSCRYGLINHWNATVAPIKYVELNPFHNKRALAGLMGKGYGYLDPSGNEVIPMQFKDATRFQEGKAAVRPDSLYGYIDTLGKWLIRPAYEDAELFSGGMAPVALPDSSWGYINTSGQMVIPSQFDYAFPFQNDTAKVHKDEPAPENPDLTITNTYWINRQGEIVEEK